MSSLANLFDEYSLRARIYPGFLTALPATSLVVLLWPKSPVSTVWPLLVSVGALLFLANWVRDSGRAVEQELIKRWGGMPTTLMLRHDGHNGGASFKRRRQMLADLVGIPLPSAEEERADAKAANDVYVAATRALITRVRAKQDLFPRVQDENTNYGFRRNLLAMKKFGVPITVAAISFDIAWLALQSGSAAWVLLALHGLVALSWLLVVNRDWVRRQGDNYANRLFETLEDPRLAA